MKNSFTLTAVAAVAAVVLAACAAEPLTGANGATSSPSPTAAAVALDENRSPQENLVEAVRSDDTALAQLAIDAGADVNEYDAQTNYGPLTYAIQRDSLEMVEFLLDAGAIVEWEEFEFTELNTAAQWSGAAVVQALIDHGADPDGFGASLGGPLNAAAYYGNLASLNTLLEAGAWVDQPFVDTSFVDTEYTALVSAAYGGRQEAVELLLSWGADPNFQEPNGDTAADWARARGHREIAELLSGLQDA